MNHYDQINTQLSRDSFPMAKLNISDDFTSVVDFDWSQATLEGYQCHGALKAPVAA